MLNSFMKWGKAGAVVAAVALASTLMTDTSPADTALKARAVAPKTAEIEKTATLDALLSKSKAADWSTSKGAVLEGYVIQVIRSNDEDVRLYLATKPGETDTRKWVILEVKPGWGEKSPALASAKLWDLQGKKIRATGWLFFDNTAIKYPRGTNWEVHPATEITVVNKGRGRPGSTKGSGVALGHRG